jgi:hypothetical protein
LETRDSIRHRGLHLWLRQRRCCKFFSRFNIDANSIQSVIFRDASLGVTARQVRAKGAVAFSDREVAIEADKTAASIVSSFPAGSSIYSSPSPRKSPVKAFFRNARNSLLPSYHSRAPYPINSSAKSPTKKSGHDDPPMSPVMNISGPLNINPQFAHLIKPELSHHPSNRRADGSF